MTGKIIFAVAFFIVAIVFIEVGVYSFLNPKPMHFWSGTSVEIKNPSDTKKFNRLNAMMWIFSAIPLLAFAALGFCFPLGPLGLVSGIYLVALIFAMIFFRHRIEKKYCARNILH